MNIPLGPDDHVVVVGSGLAGWRLCEALRREGFRGKISLVGGETDLPYDRPPLSKQILSGKWDAGKATLATASRLAELAITTRFGATAISLDVDAGIVALDDASIVRGTHVVIATGTRARTLPYSATSRVHTLRSLDDVRRLSDAVAATPPDTQVVVIGGGFVGAEVATSLRARGLAPLVLEAMAAPLLSIVGADAASWLLSLPSTANVELRTNQKVIDVVDDGNGCRVDLDDGTSLRSPFVVVSVGALPNTEWLASSKLTIDNGVVVDDHLLATERVGAVGDVARFTWRHDPFVDHVRIEHWEVANTHAGVLAATLVHGASDTPSIDLVPYFWSDQYGKKIQMLGHPSPDDDVLRVSGSVDEGKWLALYSRDGIVTGLLALNQPRALMLSRPLVERHDDVTSARALAPWQS